MSLSARQLALQSNIWKYTLLLVTNKRVFVAVLGAYYMTVPGVDTAWVGIILFISSLAGFIFEVPSGYLSDKFGHKSALVLSRVLMLFSTGFFLITDNIPLLILAGVFMSISHAFHSGTGSAFMHATLDELGRESEYTKIMGKASSIGFAVPIIFMVLVPFLVGISFKLPFVVALIIDMFGLCAALSLVRPATSQAHIDEVNATNFRQVLQAGHELQFFRHALFLGVVSGAMFGISAFRPIYQEFLGIPIIWFGVLFGIGRAGASLLLAYSESIRQVIKSLPNFYLVQLILYTGLFIVLGTVSKWWVVALVFIVINAFTWGLSQVAEGYLVEIIKGSKFKATLLSTKSLINELVGAVAGLGMGFLFSYVSYQVGFLYFGVLFFVTLLPLYWFIKGGNTLKKLP
jgi:MFS family permease